jgi:hypothetical protein
MGIKLAKLLAIAGILVVAVSARLFSQQAAPDGRVLPYAPEQLDQMLAPIALYPDALLSQMLMASTYPLEVVQADRWLRAPGNAVLRGNQLADALAPLPWDPSVKSLVPFPRILYMMDDNLDWTERLGNAFLTNEAAVMDAIQRLRSRAKAAGKLASTERSTVSDEDGAIVIAPADPALIYVPVYDPYIVYGPWPYPAYPPVAFPGIWGGVSIGDLGFGWVGFSVVLPLWGWSYCNWHDHRIDVVRGRFGNTHRSGAYSGSMWEHDPAHRHGVPYSDVTPSRRAGVPAVSPDLQRTFRGYSVPSATPPAPSARSTPTVPARPAYPSPQRMPPPPPAARPATGSQSPGVPPSFESFGRGASVRNQALRGQASRMSSSPPHQNGGSGRSMTPQVAPSGGHGRR